MLFQEAATQWLIDTDQPIEALEHPAFKNMVDIAARATNGVILPDHRQTQRAIIDLFKQNLTNLRKRLLSEAVKGRVNVTCDGWLTSNADGYFAVTGHWIEEQSFGVWKVESALLDFTRLNHAHNGKRLGQALFKVMKCVGIAHKIGYVTCDNVANNDTMMEHFSKHIEDETKKKFDFKKQRLRCLAHIINLATQALLSTHSKSKHVDAMKPDDDLVVSRHGQRDEVGLVRSIAVKERSSASRKELFRNIQLRDEDSHVPTANPRHLLLDMKVQWSSTFVMLRRAFEMCEDVNYFVGRLTLQERDASRHKKIASLELSEDEWSRVQKLLSILGFAELAQHSFSSEEGPTLHLALPALKALHSAWSSRSARIKYIDFHQVLDAAVDKISDYYMKSASSDAHIMAMLLDPTQKAAHIRRYWGNDLLHEALENAEAMYKECYLEMHGDDAEKSSASTELRTSTGNHRLDVLLNELSDGDEDALDTPYEDPATLSRTSSACLFDSVDPLKPRLHDFHAYLNLKDHLGGMSIIQWWGINSPCYPVWASLACDFLSVMATSVSSERAFLSAGITISKRRNRLKPDIVEALQCLKCMIKQGLLFCEDPSIITEGDGDLDHPEPQMGDLLDVLGEELDDEVQRDSDDEDVFVQSLDML